MINLFDILEAADGQLFGEPAAQLFTDFCYDAPLAAEGQLYVALKTGHGDGHEGMAEAVARGAAGLMCVHPPTFDTSGLSVIVMRNVEEALMRWTRLVLEKYGTTVVAITGTVGRATARAAITQVLGVRYSVYTHAGGINGRFGLPLALGQLTREHAIAILEFAPEQGGDMAEMVETTHPIAGVITTLQSGAAGWGLHPEASLEQVMALIEALPDNGLCVLNFNDPATRTLADACAAPVMTLGLDTSGTAFGADLLAYNLLIDRYKTGFDLRHGSERHLGRWVPVLGTHQLQAALCGLAVGLNYGIALEDGLQALTRLDPLPGHRVPLDGIEGSLLIDDCADPSPQDALAALDWLQAVRDERSQTLVALGDLSVPAGRTSLVHLYIGQRIAEVADHLITLGDLSAAAGRAALESGMDREHVALTFNTEDAAQAIREVVGPHDLVLVKGQRMSGLVRRLLADPQDARLVTQDALPALSMASGQRTQTTWVEVDLDAIAYNSQRLAAIFGGDIALLADVRANAYGHGAIAVSTTAIHNGFACLGVTSLDEAIALRHAGIDAPVLILGYTPPETVREVAGRDLTLTLYALEQARALDRAADSLGVTVRAHVLLDSGANTLGILPDEVTTFFRAAQQMPHLHIAGFYTYFATEGHDLNALQEQRAVFEAAIAPLLAAGFRFEYLHAASAASAIHLPEVRYNMVRAADALYGLSPGPMAPLPADFRPALSWKTRIVQVKRLGTGSRFGEGGAHQAPSAQIIGLIPVGFAGGFRHGPLRWKRVLVNGEAVPVVGRVGLDLSVIDVTTVPDVHAGQEVVLLGRQGRAVLTVDDIAGFLDTVPHEVLCHILPHATHPP